MRSVASGAHVRPAVIKRATSFFFPARLKSESGDERRNWRGKFLYMYTLYSQKGTRDWYVYRCVCKGVVDDVKRTRMLFERGRSSSNSALNLFHATAIDRRQRPAREMDRGSPSSLFKFEHYRPAHMQGRRSARASWNRNRRVLLPLFSLFFIPLVPLVLRGGNGVAAQRWLL